MALSYNKLWKRLIDCRMSPVDLRRAAEIAPNTMTKLRRDEEVSLAVLQKICTVLEADIGDIMTFRPERSAFHQQQPYQLTCSDFLQPPVQEAYPEELLFQKAVDQSVLKVGMTLPCALHETILRSLRLPHLQRGEKHMIRILIADEAFDASIINVHFSNPASQQVLQLRYAEGSPLCRRLNELFCHSAGILASSRAAFSPSRSFPASEREFIDLYAVGPGTIAFRCFPRPAPSGIE